MKQWKMDYFSSPAFTGDAMKILEIQYSAFRAYEGYIFTIIPLLFAIMAYLWKEVGSSEAPSSYVVAAAFSIVFGINFGFAHVFSLYLGIGRQIIEYESALVWLPARPQVQTWLAISGGDLSVWSPPLWGLGLVPLATAGLSSLFFYSKFVAPLRDCAGLASVGLTEPWWSISRRIRSRYAPYVYTALILLTGPVYILPAYLGYVGSVLKAMPAQNFEIGSGLGKAPPIRTK